MNKIEIFKALSNETRLSIIEWLKEPEKNFPPQGGHFDDAVDLKAGLLLSERHGKWTYYRRNEETLAALADYFDHEI